MDLNVWTNTIFEDAEYDDDAQQWNLRVGRADGTIREIHPRHCIIASGINVPQRIPEIMGIDTFTGEWSHSGDYQRGAEHDGRNVLVVGSGVSAHEMSSDLYEYGANVTMAQRGKTYVITFDRVQQVLVRRLHRKSSPA